jgi:hypothetical protein
LHLSEVIFSMTASLSFGTIPSGKSKKISEPLSHFYTMARVSEQQLGSDLDMCFGVKQIRQIFFNLSLKCKLNPRAKECYRSQLTSLSRSTFTKHAFMSDQTNSDAFP